MLCGYCKFYYEGPSFVIQKNCFRTCTRSGKEVKVQTSNPACDLFERNHRFTCKNYFQRINFVQCQYRHEHFSKYPRDWSGCQRCRQYSKEIQHLVTDEEKEYKLSTDPVEMLLVKRKKKVKLLVRRETLKVRRKK